MRRLVFGLALVWLGWRIRPSLELRPYSVRVEARPEQLARELRERLGMGGEVLAEGEDSLVARFAGTAGGFRWSTLELVRFTPGRVEFEHLGGAFRSARERFTLRPEGDGTRLEHTGRFRLPGGLLGWALGLLFVRRLFESHVAEHMDAAVLRHGSAGQSAS